MCKVIAIANNICNNILSGSFKLWLASKGYINIISGA